MSEPTEVTVLEAGGKTLEELQARFRCELLHEEDPTDPRPCVRILRFMNLTQVMEFAQLFDPGAHADVWFTEPWEVTDLFDQQVCLSVVFRQATRPATVHGEDDMREVVRSLRTRGHG